MTQPRDTAAVQAVITKARELGAAEVTLVPASEIVVAHWVRLKCQFGCAEYNQRLSCPPHVPSIDTTRKILEEYESIILIRSPPEGTDSGWDNINTLMVALERWTFLQGHYKAFALTSGPCPHCSTCNVEKCVHPDQARPSMEAMGIDVYATVKNAGFTLQVVTSHEETATYHGLLLLQ